MQTLIMSSEALFPLEGARVFVAGHRGMVGSALVRRLQQEPVETVLTASRVELDLTRQVDVDAWMARNRPDVVLLAAAKVGGILANDRYPVDFLLQNLQIQTNLMAAAHRVGTRKLVFLGSSCIYPKMAPQPIPESALLTGPLEPTNEWYAVAKIAGLKLAQAYRRQHGADFISVMPTNLYGPGDNYDPEGSHVIPALLRKAHEAQANGLPDITVWGTGTPRREFMHVDDLADAVVFLLRHYSGETHVNVGVGSDISIADLAELVARIVGFEGKILFDTSKPDGAPRKMMDSSRLSMMGWKPHISLEDGLADVYRTVDFDGRA
jgi:GDP-L-fucose synthase